MRYVGILFRVPCAILAFFMMVVYGLFNYPFWENWKDEGLKDLGRWVLGKEPRQLGGRPPRYMSWPPPLTEKPVSLLEMQQSNDSQ